MSNLQLAKIKPIDDKHYTHGGDRFRNFAYTPNLSREGNRPGKISATDRILNSEAKVVGDKKNSCVLIRESMEQSLNDLKLTRNKL